MDQAGYVQRSLTRGTADVRYLSVMLETAQSLAWPTNAGDLPVHLGLPSLTLAQQLWGTLIWIFHNVEHSQTY